MKIEDIEEKDLSTIVGEGLTLRDILNGATTPDMLSVEDIIFLWPYLPEDRRAELKPQIDHLIGSLPNPPDGFDGWQKLYNKSPYCSFESRLSILEMARSAVSYRESFIAFNSAEAGHLQIKRLTTERMVGAAVTEREKENASNKYREVHPEARPASEPKEGT